MASRWEKRLPFFYGWVVFAITFLIYMFMYGLRYSIGIFFIPIQKEFGWSTAATASGVTIFFWVYAFSAPFVGRLAEKIGVRKTVLLGGLLLGGGGAMVSFITELWQFYVAWGVIAAMGSAALYIVPTMALSKFFHHKRGMTVGWSSVGVSAGQALLIPIVASLVPSWGWRASIQALGIVVMVVTSIIGFLFLREDPESLGLHPDGYDGPIVNSEDSHGEVNWATGDAMRTNTFRLVAVSYFFAVGGIISILTFVVPHMISIGITSVQASGAFGMIGLMSAIGSFIFGIVSDRYGRRITILVTTAGIASALFVATVIPANLTILYLWAVLYGLSYGGAPEQYAAIITDYFGRKDNTTLFGVLTLAGGIGGGLFPLIGGWLVDRTGSYYATLVFLGAAMAMATFTSYLAKPPRKAS
ncbi:MAG: MFS transporter [Candidatus Bathyarchaeota archaeon]|nr:MFS transporter [Candidatus Bathyarchaeota archaeon]